MNDSIGYDVSLSSEKDARQASGSAAPSKAKSDIAAVDFSTSLSTWREIQLPSLQKDLASLCPTLIEAQKDALLSRKKLAEQTREFKKLDSNAQPDAIKPLLKAYQSEIDSLTKRAKMGENAVLGMRDRLQNATDPYPILEVVLEQTAVMGDVETLNLQLERLQSANTTLESQLASLQSVEADRARLTKRVVHLEGSAAELRRGVEAELSAKWDERIRNSKAREDTLAKSLESTQAQLKDMRANYAKVTERLLQHGEEVERQETNGKIEELDMISEELSRSNERAAAMERRNEQLRQEMERIKSGLGEDERIVESERRAVEAEEESRKLSKMLEDESKRTKTAEELTRGRISEAELHVKEKERESEALRERIRRMADYDEVKRELEIFKYVEFAVEADRRLDDDERLEQDPSPTAAKPLEALLIEKNRQLQDEATGFRVANSELSASVEQVRRELQASQSEAARLKKLSERLEDDLLSVRPMAPSVRPAPSKTTSMSAEEALAEMDSLAGTPSADIHRSTGSVATVHPAQVTGTDVDSVSASPVPFEAGNTKIENSNPSTASSSSSILPIITSQRDRFRARNAELEEELRRQFTTITELRNEVKTLQADNMSLYEKVRYLQTYRVSGAAAGGGGVRVNGTRTVEIAATARNDYSGSGGTYPPSMGEDKYREKYEASMNPFEQFRGREQSRALSALNPLERLLHMLTRVVLGHRRTRIFFVVYALCLHLLVFAMVFEVEFGTASAPAVLLDGVTPV